MLVKIDTVDGDATWQLRANDASKGEPRYRGRAGYAMRLDVPPSVREVSRRPDVRLWVTEGSRKVDALLARGHFAIGLAGVDCWRGRAALPNGRVDEGSESAPLRDWDEFALLGRPVVIAFDRDILIKPNIRRAALALAEFLNGRHALVGFVVPPEVPGLAKVGLDDYLGGGGSVAELLATLTREVPGGDPEVDRQVRRLRVSREARHLVDEDEALRAWVEPPSTPTLAEELLLPDDTTQPTIASLAGQGHNVVLAAQFKAGKTTLLANLARSLADGEPFLQKFGVRPVAGRIGYVNLELTRDDFRGLLRRTNVLNPERIVPLTLRGHRWSLTSDFGRERFVAWLRDREVEVLILDPWARVLAGLGENDNDAVTRLTEALDEIKQDAGVADLFIAAHTPRQEMEEGAERVRGASRLDDWADSRWIYTRDVKGNRYLRVEGRGVGHDEVRLAYDRDIERLWVDGGSRREERARSVVDEVVAIVAAQPGVVTNALKDQLKTSSNNSERSAAVQAAERDGRIEHRPGPRNSKVWYPTSYRFPWESWSE